MLQQQSSRKYLTLHRRRLAALGAARAFTMIELLVSIALVVVLMVGINAVFKYSADAVGTGQALGDGARQNRAIQAVMTQDLSTCVTNGSNPSDAALFQIVSYAMPMFRDRKDEAGSQSGAASPIPRQLKIDLNGNGIEGENTVPGEIISPVIYNFRNHRTDTLTFFSRDVFHRQTGNPGAYVANQNAREAMIWYGHLWLPDNTAPTGLPDGTTGTPAAAWTQKTLPGAANSASVNPNNYYASQIVLGRVAMLLANPDTGGGTQFPGKIFIDPFAKTNSQFFVQKSNAGSRKLSPLGNKTWNDLSVTDANATDNFYTLHQSRYDLAGTSILQFQQDVISFIQSGYAGGTVGALYGPSGTTWWQCFTSNFQCEPFLVRQPKANGQVDPISSSNVARAHPYFVKGCSQFVVEFAGDFVTQNNDPMDADGRVNGSSAKPDPTDGSYGDVQVPYVTQAYGNNTVNPPQDEPTPASDGVIDFVVDKSDDPGFQSPIAQNNQANPALWKRKIRWYGFPRDDNNDGVVQTWFGGYAQSPNAIKRPMVDVVPVRDVVRTSIYANDPKTGAPYTSFTGFPWEHFNSIGTTPSQTYPSATAPSFAPPAFPGNYADINAGIQPSRAYVYTTMPTYVVAMGPYDPRVKMIRITLNITDPTGRLAEGQWFQYVFTLP